MEHVLSFHLDVPMDNVSGESDNKYSYFQSLKQIG